jgi:Sec-independent protein translocase protein TatA
MTRMFAVLSAALLFGATSLPALACSHAGASAENRSVTLAQAETGQEESKPEAQMQPEAQASPEAEQAQPSQPEAKSSPESGQSTESGASGDSM